MNNIFKNVLIFLSFITISASAIYFFVVFPNVKAANFERLNKERVVNIDNCIKTINEKMYEELDMWCSRHGQTYECYPTDEILSELNTKANNQIKRCYVKYPEIVN